MNPELLRTRQYLVIALRDFIPRCNGNFNMFRQELDRLVSVYTIPDNTNVDDINTLHRIRDSLNNLTNDESSLNKYIWDCEGVICNNTNIELLKELAHFIYMTSLKNYYKDFKG